jgi:hypothetical protein
LNDDIDKDVKVRERQKYLQEVKRYRAARKQRDEKT